MGIQINDWYFLQNADDYATLIEAETASAERTGFTVMDLCEPPGEYPIFMKINVTQDRGDLTFLAEYITSVSVDLMKCSFDRHDTQNPDN